MPTLHERFSDLAEEAPAEPDTGGPLAQTGDVVRAAAGSAPRW